jgi:hypothetical protein
MSREETVLQRKKEREGKWNAELDGLIVGWENLTVDWAAVRAEILELYQ